MIPVLRAILRLQLARKRASNVRPAVTPHLDRVHVRSALLARSTRLQGRLLYQNATSARQELTAVKAPLNAQNVLKEVSRAQLGLQVAVFVLQAHPALFKAQLPPVTVSLARQPSTLASQALLSVMLAQMASLP